MSSSSPKSTYSTDLIRRFLFEESDIRGEITILSKSFQDTLNRQKYPEKIQHLLGEFVAAACLLSNTLKFDGTLSIQAKGQGDISLILAECTSRHTLRAITHHQKVISGETLQELLKGGQIAITIDPTEGNRYQGIIPIESNSLAGCLEDYFLQSEQLTTRIWLSANGEKAAGLLLQALPQQKAASADETSENWNRIIQLSDTITDNELLSLDHETLLHRLYNEEVVRLFDPDYVKFQCTCSRERTSMALKSLGQKAALEIIRKKNKITVDCQFCGHRYDFREGEVNTIFGDQEPTLH